MNNKFVNKLLDYLKDNTEIERYEKLPDINSVYDGYIIAPIGNGFRWDYYNRSLQEDGDFVNEFWIDMKEIYSLKDEEVMYVMGEYQDFIWDLLDKQQSNINETNTDKETINESWYYQYVLDHKFLNKVLEQFILETELPEEFLSKQDLINNIIIRWDSKEGDLSYDKFFGICRDIYGLTAVESNDLWQVYMIMIRKQIESTINPKIS